MAIFQRIGTRSAKSLDAACKELQKHGATPVQEPHVIDCCHGRTVNAVYDQVPCLTRARCMSGGYFLTHKQRFMSVEEMLQLQGFARDCAEKARAMAITPRSLAGMVGNAVSVDILEVLLDRVLGALHTASDLIYTNNIMYPVNRFNLTKEALSQTNGIKFSSKTLQL